MVGLLGNVIRFIYISFITWPWLVLPFEFLQGITHAAVWAACCSFISHNTDAELRPHMQSFLQVMSSNVDIVVTWTIVRVFIMGLDGSVAQCSVEC